MKHKTSNRLADYFLVVSYGDELDPIDTATVTSSENIHIEPDAIPTPTATLNTPTATTTLPTSSSGSTLQAPSTTTRTFPVSTSTTAATLSISPSASPLTNSRQLHHVVSEPLQLSTPPRTITFLSAEALAQAEAAVASAIAESPHPHSHTQQHSHSHPHAAIPRSASHGLHARTPSHGMLQTNPQQTQLGIFSRRASNTIPSSPQHASTDHRRSPSSSASLPSSNPGHRRHTTHHAFLDRVYRARVIDRFPRQDYPEEPFPPGISMFCLPEDIHLSTQPDILPSFHYFCATTGDGHRLYGACLKFWEQVPATIVKKMEQRDRAERKAARQRVLSHALQSAANGGSFADAIMLHTTSTPELSDEESDYEDHSPLEYNSEDEWSEYDGRMGGAIVDEVLGMEQETQHVTSTECMSRSGSANTHRTEESTSLALSPVNQITSDVTSSSPTSSDHSFSVTPLVIPNTNVTTRPASRSHPSSPNKENDPHHLSRPSVSRPASTNQRTYSMNSHIHSTNSHHSHKRDLPAVYAPKCIALLSSHPFLSGFRTFLTQLYRLSLTPLTIPIEHWLTNFLLETPLPPLGECTVQYHVADQIITFARAPPNQPFSIHHFPLRYLFECLELENVITLVECVLCERRILLLSDKLSLLTIVGQTLMTLIFPFQWQHVFIPLLPKALIDFLNAPMPYIIGMHTTWLPADADVLQSDLSDELVIVRLDNNTITCRTSLPPHIPKHQRNKLKKYFQTHFPTIYKGNHGRNEYQQAQFDNMDLAFNYAPSPEQIEDNSEIESKQKDEDASLASSFFFRVYVSILRDYRNYLIYPSTSQQQRTDSLFDTAAFLKSQDSSGHAFLTQFMNTQGFQQFIEDRIMGGDRENESSIDYAVQFFDESICAKRNRSKLTRKKLDTPFLLDRSMDITRTFVAPAPEIVNTQGTHVYPTFPRLDDSLFAPPRYMSPLGKTSRQPGVVEDQQAWENAPSTHEQVVHTVWFICFTAIMSERKIDYTERAFGVFDQMRRTDTTPESDIFGPLMYACGRAGVPDKAVRVLHEMQNWGYPVSATLYALLLQVFSMNGNHEGYQALADLRKRPQSQGILSSWRSARKSATKSKTKPSKSKHGKIVDVTSPPRSTPNSPGLNTSQLPLYQRYQAQFERVFAGLTINTLESCPECNRVLTDADIRVGWSRNCNDYNTKCPCGERFVARFTVRPTPRKNEDQHSPRSKTTIHCEYLSPRVLRKEITNLLHTKSASYLATATFRRTSHTIFWNLMWHFTNYKLPVDHLLPPVTTGTGPSSGATSPRHAANKLSKAHTLSSLPAASTCTSTSSHHPASISMSTSTPGLPSLTSSISSSLPAPLSLSLSLVSPSSSSSVSEVPGAASETNAIAQAATAAVSSAADHLPPHLREVG